MKDVIITMLFVAPAVLLSSGAVAMIYFDKSGWGWLLFSAVLLHGCTRIKTDDDKDEQ